MKKSISIPNEAYLFEPPSEFIPTKHSKVEDKEKFAEQFKKFVLGGFKKEDFTKWFYVQLSYVFGNIAHYDQAGFYNYHFSRPADTFAFVMQCIQHPCYGSPNFTYSDVEKHLQVWLREQLNYIRNMLAARDST